jgi:hypothetical protein
VQYETNSFAFGARGGIFTTSTPAAANTASNDSANFASRSRIRSRKLLIRSPRSMTTLRACWVVHSAVGWPVTPTICTRRVAISITNKTYNRRSAMVSTWKKSVANSPDACAGRNVRQLVSTSRGAGPILPAARIRRMVLAPTRWPRPTSSP